MDEKKPKPRGPKPRPREELRRNSITFRALDDLRSRLMVDAAKRGRSLSEEVEARLEQSFSEDTMFRMLVGGDPLSDMLQASRWIIRKVQQTAKNTKRSETETRKEIAAALDVVARAYLQTEDYLLPDDPKDSSARGVAFGWMEWNDDKHLEEAQAGDIFDHWTGDGKKLEAELEIAAELDSQVPPPPRSLADIMNEGSDRDRTASAPVRKARKPKA